MIDNLSVVGYALARHMLTSLSVDKKNIMLKTIVPPASKNCTLYILQIFECYEN